MTEDTKASVEIGVNLPIWLPPVLHFPARVLFGVVIGLMVAFYCIALSSTINRIWGGLSSGARQDDLAFDVAYLAVMVGAFYVLRHVLKRGRARPAAEM